MMSRHFALSSELSGAIAKRLPHAKNQLSVTCSFFNQFVTEIYIYTTRTKVFDHHENFQTNSSKLNLLKRNMSLNSRNYSAF